MGEFVGSTVKVDVLVGSALGVRVAVSLGNDVFVVGRIVPVGIWVDTDPGIRA